jgi:surface protein
MNFSNEDMEYFLYNCLYRYYYNPESSKEISKIYKVCKMFKNSIDETQEYLKSLYFIPKTNQELQTAVNEWCDNREGTLVKYGNISLWITVNITDMNNLFHNKIHFNDCIKDWDTSSVTDISYMFENAKAFNQPLNNWDTSSVTSMRWMFRIAKLFNQPLNNWDTSSVTTMGGMFYQAKSFNQPLNNWDTSSVIYIRWMFNDAKSFNQGLNNWNTSSVIDMQCMFSDSNMSVLPIWYEI